MNELRQGYAQLEQVKLHYVECGAGPLVVLLHGFPEFWYSWRRQLPALAAAGFRAVAPDLRGYNLSDKPPGVAAYRVSELAGDVEQLVRHFGQPHAAVAGHDWGGAVAWTLAALHPQVVRKLVILNAPHPALFERELKSVGQLRRSWYVFFFQIPRLPEALLRARNFRSLTSAFRRDPVRPGAFTEEDLERYREAFRRPGALTAAVNYYRAALRARKSGAEVARRPISAPTLLLWGLRDRYLGPRLARGLEEWVPKLQTVLLENASHWLQHDAAEEVNRRLIDFLRE